MRNESIEGIGSVIGGEYDKINISGMGKLKGGANAKKVTVEGMFKSKGTLQTDELIIEGMARIFRDVKAGKINIAGLLKLRRASITADKILCEGGLICTREVNADVINITGICSVNNMYGDKINIKNAPDNLQNVKLPKLRPFLRLYFGRDVDFQHSTADIIECTEINAMGLKSKIIRAKNIQLSDYCFVDKVYCDGEITIDDTCHIGEIISDNPVINKKKELDKMADANFVKILDLYKSGKINADEAEQMINSNTDNIKSPDTPWKDDGKLRIVAFIGKKLLKKGEPNAKSIEVKYDGKACNVECHGSLICSDIKNNASAGASIRCKDIGGNVSCGGSIRCKDVKGNIAAGGSVRLTK